MCTQCVFMHLWDNSTFILVRVCVLCRASQSQGNWMPGQSAKSSKLNVALHAQSKFELHGFVAGSEVTTAGIAAALQAAPNIGEVKVFAPFSYKGLLDERCGQGLSIVVLVLCAGDPHVGFWLACLLRTVIYIGGTSLSLKDGQALCPSSCQLCDAAILLLSCCSFVWTHSRHHIGSCEWTWTDT
jgi:hypothetical protein